MCLLRQYLDQEKHYLWVLVQALVVVTGFDWWDCWVYGGKMDDIFTVNKYFLVIPGLPLW